MSHPQSPKLIVLFDGICKLCHRSVQFIIQHDKHERIYFASLQSNYGKLFLTDRGLAKEYSDSMIFFDGEHYYTQSTAWLKLMYYLPWPWRLTIIFWIIPRIIRDAVYDFIAKRRYRYFGRFQECRLVQDEYRERFLL